MKELETANSWKPIKKVKTEALLGLWRKISATVEKFYDLLFLFCLEGSYRKK